MDHYEFFDQGISLLNAVDLKKMRNQFLKSFYNKKRIFNHIKKYYPFYLTNPKIGWILLKTILSIRG